MKMGSNSNLFAIYDYTTFPLRVKSIRMRTPRFGFVSFRITSPANLPNLSFRHSRPDHSLGLSARELVG